MQKIKSRVFLYFHNLISENKKGLFVDFIKIFLFFISIFWKAGVFLVNFLYEIKIFKAKKVDPLVISIGNIVAGGTGKTPFTIFLADLLKEKLNVAIITRGYRSKFENSNVMVQKSNIKQIGDEALLLKKRTNLNIFLGKDRIASINHANKLKHEVVLLDDGFQYKKLKKDLEIVLLDANKPFGNNYFLPRGFLRESPSSLKKADFVVGVGCIDAFERSKKILSKYTNAKILRAEKIFDGFYDLKDQKVSISSKAKIAAYCAIGNPQSFFENLKKLNLEIIYKRIFLDHDDVDMDEIKDFAKKAIENNAKYIVITEKDAVKLDNNINVNIPIIYLKINLEIISECKSQLVEKIYEMIYN